MTDIVERLRRFKTGCDKPECERMIFTPLVCEEAAAEIERLRAALRMLYDEMDEYQRINNLSAYNNQVMRQARAALEGK